MERHEKHLLSSEDMVSSPSTAVQQSGVPPHPNTRETIESLMDLKVREILVMLPYPLPGFTITPPALSIIHLLSGTFLPREFNINNTRVQVLWGFCLLVCFTIITLTYKEILESSVGMLYLDPPL